MSTQPIPFKIPEMITIKEASSRSGLSYDSIRKKCLSGEIVCIRNGSKFFVNWDRFVDYLNGELEKEDYNG